jgi:hypothetical protein
MIVIISVESTDFKLGFILILMVLLCNTLFILKLVYMALLRFIGESRLELARFSRTEQ